MIGRLWKSMFWTERQASVEFGPTLAARYPHLIEGLSDHMLLALHDELADDMHAAAEADRRPRVGVRR